MSSNIELTNTVIKNNLIVENKNNSSEHKVEKDDNTDIDSTPTVTNSSTEYKNSESDIDSEESNNDDSSSEESDSEGDINLLSDFLVEDNEKDIFVISIDGTPSFYSDTLQDARFRMWQYAKFRRLQEINYNSYIRACPDKNRLEVVGSNKFYVFSIDRPICWLTISTVKQLKKCNKNVQKNTEEQITSSQEQLKPTELKNTGISSFFW
jgi:hypothetical protein